VLVDHTLGKLFSTVKVFEVLIALISWSRVISGGIIVADKHCLPLSPGRLAIDTAADPGGCFPDDLRIVSADLSAFAGTGIIVP
jgi:hypothetical protein